MNPRDLKKISDVVWEIPKSYRKDMRVPGRIYATEKMLKEIIRDRSLDQLVNTTTLKGILKVGMAMPDAHEGYGFPIGGVVAMKWPDGVISPGGVGYDINCIHPDTIVALPFGTFLKASDLHKKWQHFDIHFINKEYKRLGSSEIINFNSRKEENFIYEIKTKFGLSLRVTGEHPIYTSRGMIRADELTSEDDIISYPFKGVHFEKSEEKILDENDFHKLFRKLNLTNAGNRVGQMLSWLRKRNFISINYDSPVLPYLIKVLGYALGDGAMNFIGKNKSGHITLYGSKHDLESINRDLDKIGVKGRIYNRTRDHTIKTSYNRIYEFQREEYSLHIRSRAFLLLLHLLGAPLGNKTQQQFSVPTWLKEAPLWQKRLFLSSFFGAEMSAPSTLNKYNFYRPSINLNKSLALKENGYAFLYDIKILLDEFGVKSVSYLTASWLTVAP